MKKYILNILLFFAIVAIIDISVGYIGDYLQSHAKGGETLALNNLVMHDTHDVIILGSSRARCHYDTPFLCDTLSLDVYNAGYEGNGVILSYGLLEMILERYRPRLVLYDVETSFDITKYVPDNNNKRYINMLKPYYKHSGVAEVIKDVSCEEWYKVHSGFIRYNSSILSLVSENIHGRPILEAGYKPAIGVYSGDARPVEPLPPIDSLKLKYVEKLLLLSLNNEVPIAVVASPKYGKNSSSDLQPIKDICIKLDIPFLDYYADSIFMKNKELFKEPMHLNADGARLFSTMIIKDIDCMLND